MQEREIETEKEKNMATSMLLQYFKCFSYNLGQEFTFILKMDTNIFFRQQRNNLSLISLPLTTSIGHTWNYH